MLGRTDDPKKASIAVCLDRLHTGRTWILTISVFYLHFAGERALPKRGYLWSHGTAELLFGYMHLSLSLGVRRTGLMGTGLGNGRITPVLWLTESLHVFLKTK